MANPRMTLLDLLSKSEQGADPEFLRDGLKLLAQELMEAEVTQVAGAGLHERSDSRLTYRNGYREREWDTRVGTLELEIPSFAPAATSRACWSHAGVTSERCSRWSKRRMCTGSAHAPSTPLPKPWA